MRWRPSRRSKSTKATVRKPSRSPSVGKYTFQPIIKEYWVFFISQTNQFISYVAFILDWHVVCTLNRNFRIYSPVWSLEVPWGRDRSRWLRQSFSCGAGASRASCPRFQWWVTPRCRTPCQCQAPEVCNGSVTQQKQRICKKRSPNVGKKKLKNSETLI